MHAKWEGAKALCIGVTDTCAGGSDAVRAVAIICTCMYVLVRERLRDLSCLELGVLR